MRNSVKNSTPLLLSLVLLAACKSASDKSSLSSPVVQGPTNATQAAATNFSLLLNATRDSLKRLSAELSGTQNDLSEMKNATAAANESAGRAEARISELTMISYLALGFAAGAVGLGAVQLSRRVKGSNGGEEPVEPKGGMDSQRK